ncbi:MAG: DUF1207 domain-containing protein [Bacteroidetes bacterium]|nr:DUF1207 domain-containing protein [Bacteroidota bacterium]
MRRLFLLHLLLILPLTANERGFSFTNAPLQFMPLTANTFEPRVGLIWHANDNRLRLDIGNSIDLIQYHTDAPGARFTIGSDFFTYTLLSGEKNFHFPVDAVDYLFGFNASYADTLRNGVLSSRLRLSHISAHFVDGHFNGSTGTWKDGLNPRVYSREFFDWTIAFAPQSNIRGYVGLYYLWHVDPTTLPQWMVYAGGEYSQPITTVLHGYTAYQFTATGLLPRHEFQAGVKLGDWTGRGTKFFFVLHRGNSIHGEYHDITDAYSGFGFNIDL